MKIKTYLSAVPAIMAALALTACGRTGDESLASYDSTDNGTNSVICAAESNIEAVPEKNTGAFAQETGSNVGETSETEETVDYSFSTAEEAAESFIEGYYKDAYLCEPLNTEKRVVYKGLADYIETFLGYWQDSLGSNVTKWDRLDVKCTLRDKEELDDAVQIIVTNDSDHKICDFVTLNDFNIRDIHNVDKENIFWADSQAAEEALAKLKEE